jgi:uncharacterized lipoprotein NlpE involved in copper resistance
MLTVNDSLPFSSAEGYFGDWDQKAASPYASLWAAAGVRERCAGAYAEREAIAGRDAKLKIDIYTGTLEMVIRDGVPAEFSFDSKEKFILMER